MISLFQDGMTALFRFDNTEEMLLATDEKFIIDGSGCCIDRLIDGVRRHDIQLVGVFDDDSGAASSGQKYESTCRHW